MAKKKSDTTESTPVAPKKPVARKAPVKKTDTPATTGKVKSATGKPGKPNGPAAGTPMIDTGLAASAAASLLLARRKGRAQVDDPVSIDQIKNDLAKPHSAVAGEVIDQHAESTGGRRPTLPFGGPSPTGNSQTVGHAAERTFVPRRTGG